MITPSGQITYECGGTINGYSGKCLPFLLQYLQKNLQYLEMYGLEKKVLSDKEMEIIYVGILVPCLKQIQRKKYTNKT